MLFHLLLGLAPGFAVQPLWGFAFELLLGFAFQRLLGFAFQRLLGLALGLCLRCGGLRLGSGSLTHVQLLLDCLSGWQNA